MDALPTGTVTFLFTDIEGSTQRWERDPNAMREALRRHDEIVRPSIAAHRGHIFKSIGDGFCAAFETAPSAVAAAADVQRTIVARDWSAVDGLFVRMAIHTGTADERDGDYFGPTLNRVSRLLGVGQGGQVLLSAATAVLVRETLRAGESLQFLGRYRLVDLSEAEPVHQLLFPGGPSSFASSTAFDEPPHNLPQPLTSYIEAERVVDDIVDQVRQSRLLTLCGAGGVGKTRTALEVARRMLDDWRDGIWFVQLESMTDSESIVRTIVSTVGARDIAGRKTSETLFEYLASRRLLLVLDNCEHIVEAVAEVVSTVIKRCRDVTVIATSREPLRITGEHLLTVEPLAVPALDPKRLPSIAELEASPAVKLFLDRARSVEPNFRFVDAHRAPVHQICLRLDGIPLALELAAARIGAFSPVVLAERLENRFVLLTRGVRGSLAHHRTLHALVDWSWSLLAQEERILFRRLAVFAGGWTLEAAEAVTAGHGLTTSDVFNFLNELCDKSLVQTEPGDVVRFRFLETIRAFALEKLDEALERTILERSHAMYFAKLARSAEPQLRSRSQHEVVSEITRDIDNYGTALDTVARDASLRDAGLALCAGLARYWLLIGAFAEGRLRLDPHAREMHGEVDTLVRVLGGSALLALNDNDGAAFIAQARRAVRVSERASDDWSIAFAAVCESAALLIVPQARDGVNEEQIHARARRLAEETGDAWLLTYVEFCEAGRAAERGDLKAALRAEEVALIHARACGDHFLIYAIALYLANLLEREDTTRAASLVLESADALEAGNVAGLAACLESAVRLAVYFERYDDAARLMGAASVFRESASVPAWRCDPDEFRERLAESLGPETFEVSFVAGRDLSFTEATEEIRSFVFRSQRKAR